MARQARALALLISAPMPHAFVLPMREKMRNSVTEFLLISCRVSTGGVVAAGVSTLSQIGHLIL